MVDVAVMGGGRVPSSESFEHQSLFEEQCHKFDFTCIHHLLGCSKVLLQRLPNLPWSGDFKQDGHTELRMVWRCKC